MPASESADEPERTSPPEPAGTGVASELAEALERANSQVEQAMERARSATEQAVERAGRAVEQAEKAAARAEQVVVADPRGIRALAHPARMEAIDQLYAGKVLTATELANLVDVSPSAMSYHLRELAKWGVIERVEDAGDGRERRWRAAGKDLQIGTHGEASRSTASRAAHMVLTRQIFDRMLTAIAEQLDGQRDEPEQWRAALSISSHELMLTKEEMHRLGDELRAVLDRYGLDRADMPDGARKVRVLTAAVPVR